MSIGIDQQIQPAIQGGYLPYGVLWYVLNLPIVLGNVEAWLIEVYSIQVFISALLILKQRYMVLCYYVAACGYLVSQHEYQDITALSLIALSSFHWIFSILTLFDKLPLGWSLTLNDAHFYYAFHNIPLTEHHRIRRYIVITVGWIGGWVYRRWLKYYDMDPKYLGARSPRPSPVLAINRPSIPRHTLKWHIHHQAIAIKHRIRRLMNR